MIKQIIELIEDNGFMTNRDRYTIAQEGYFEVDVTPEIVDFIFHYNKGEDYYVEIVTDEYIYRVDALGSCLTIFGVRTLKGIEPEGDICISFNYEEQ